MLITLVVFDTWEVLAKSSLIGTDFRITLFCGFNLYSLKMQIGEKILQTALLESSNAEIDRIGDSHGFEFRMLFTFRWKENPVPSRHSISHK